MGRNQIFSNNDIIDQTIHLIAKHGPATITITQLAKITKAPVGSIYHRFTSIDEILAEAWTSTTEEFQAGFNDALKLDSTGLKAALFTIYWSQKNPTKARMLLGYSRHDIIRKKVPLRLKQKITNQHRQLQSMLGNFIKNSKDLSQLDVNVSLFALVYMPYSAVRPYLIQKKDIPKTVTEMVKRAYLAITLNL